MPVGRNGLINSFRAVDVENSNTRFACPQISRCEGRRQS
jgi:hypothetical protein